MDIDKLEAGWELDALIATKPFGLNVLGNVNVLRDPECCCGQHWMIPFDYYADVADHGVDERPVFLSDCMCEFRDDEDVDYFGHISGCLDVVSPYSTDITAAWKLLTEIVDSTGAAMELMDYGGPEGDFERYACIFVKEKRKSSGLTEWGAEGWANTAPLAICRAALKATED